VNIPLKIPKTTLTTQYLNIYSLPQRKHRIYIYMGKINHTVIFNEIVCVYCDNYIKYMHKICGENAKFLMLKQMVRENDIEF